MAVKSALVHVPCVKTGNAWEFVVSMAEVLLPVGVSALFSAWVYVCWEYSLWVSIFIHALLTPKIQRLQVTGNALFQNTDGQRAMLYLDC